MSTIPTESRIFADRYCREIKLLEALHAGKLSPGSKTWREAMPALYKRMLQTGGPCRLRTGTIASANDVIIPWIADEPIMPSRPTTEVSVICP